MSSSADCNGWCDVPDDERESLEEWEATQLKLELLLVQPRSHWLLAIALGMLSFQVLGWV
jgi:hypothetical protein